MEKFASRHSMLAISNPAEPVVSGVGL